MAKFDNELQTEKPVFSSSNLVSSILKNSRYFTNTQASFQSVESLVQEKELLQKKLEESSNLLELYQAKIDKYHNLLVRANKENQRRNEILAYFQKIVFECGKKNEGRTLKKFITYAEEQLIEERTIQACLFDEDQFIFNELEKSLEKGESDKELDCSKLKEQDNTKSVTTKKTKKKNKKKNNISLHKADLEQLAHLPKEEKYIEDQFNGICPTCNSHLSTIGTEEVGSELVYVPGFYKVVTYKRKTFKCKTCEENNQKNIFKASTQASLLPHSLLSPSLMTKIIIDKYVKGVPLYRQEQENIYNKIPITRNTMATWGMKVYEQHLEPFCELLRNKLVENRYIHVDETRIEVLKSENKDKPILGYMWVYTTTKWNKQQIKYFDYQPGRSSKFPEKFLEGFEGYIHTDGYKGYDSVLKNNASKIKRCSCIVHLRRYFNDAIMGDNLTDNNKLALKAIEMLDQLFKHERMFNDYSPQERAKARQEYSKPLLDKFFNWAQVVKDSEVILPRGKLAKAIDYALNGHKEFSTYLSDGNCDICNNHVENAIRPFVIGRKNYLFHITDKGAKASAGYYSIIETAKANNLNPSRYIEWLLEKLPTIRPRTPESLSELLPWSDKIPNFCKAQE